MTREIKYAWFSKKQARICGTAVWSDARGWPVIISMVTSTPDHSSKWDDIECRGIVVEYVREHASGLYWHLNEVKGDACLSSPIKNSKRS